MHPDEQRDPGHLRELILRHAATQPQKLFDELQVARRRIRTLEATVVVDKSNIRTLNARVKDLTAEKVAHAQSAEDTVGVTELMGSELDESEVAASGRAESEEDGDAASSPLHNTAGPATPTTEGLVDALRDEPSAERLDELLTRLWTDEGEISPAWPRWSVSSSTWCLSCLSDGSRSRTGSWERRHWFVPSPAWCRRAHGVRPISRRRAVYSTARTRPRCSTPTATACARRAWSRA